MPRVPPGDSWDPHQDECQGLPNSREDSGGSLLRRCKASGPEMVRASVRAELKGVQSFRS